MRMLMICLFLGLAAMPLAAQQSTPDLRADAATRERTRPLVEALGIDSLLEIIRTEGLGHAEELQREMFPGRGGPRWPAMVEEIYQLDRMQSSVLDSMAAATDPDHLDALLEFFGGALGTRIVSLEISARRALLDPSVETASHEYLAMLRDEGGRRLELLEDFAEVNDLVEANVAAALNANLAFYSGLNRAGAFGALRPEADLLRDVWEQEPEVRRETALWVMSFVALAFQPLSDDDIAAYVAFSRTEPGRHVNTDLFAAFDRLFRLISEEMGMAAAQFMAGEDL